MKATPKGKARREDILKASEKVFLKKGFLETNIADITKEAGMSWGAIYHHFPSKEAILIGVAERAARSLQSHLEAWVNDDRLSSSEKVDRFLKQVESRKQFRLMVDRIGIGLAREDRDMHEIVVQLSLEMLTGHLTTIIEQGKSSGEFNVEHPRATAVTVILLLSEFVHRSGRVEAIIPREEMHAVITLSVKRMLGCPT